MVAAISSYKSRQLGLLFRIKLVFQAPRPMFDVVLALQRIANVAVTFKIDKSVYIEALCVAFDDAGLVLIDATNADCW